MTSIRITFLLLVSVVVIACADRSENSDPGTAAAQGLDVALESVTEERLKSHVDYLADDARMGRMTGTQGYDDSAAYVAQQFEAMGLQPGGEDGWYQPVPLLTNRLDVASASVVLHRDGTEQALVWKEDFVMGGDTVRERTEVKAEVVFAGFAVHAPDLGYTDFEHIDLSGKIVAAFRGAPASFPHNERAYYSSTRTKAEELVKRGASGVIWLLSRVDQERVPWDRLIANAGLRPGMAWVNEAGDAADYHPEIEGVALLGVAGAQNLFKYSSISFDEALDAAESGTPASQPLEVEVTLARNTRHERITSPNVIGVLPGSDPALANEYVVYTAHLDHVGTGAPVNNDDIYNGAYDNAMGIGLMLEAARGLAALPSAPKRSIMFLAVTGEERGLLGSDYYAHYPTVPIDTIIANVNLDMPLFLFPLADIVAFGSEHSSLEEIVRVAAGEENFSLTPDPVPEEVIFIRSDQYSFVRKGVPATYLVHGENSTDPEFDGAAINKDHLKNHYHRPSDDLTRPVHWPSAVRFGRANIRIGYAIAEDTTRPTWNIGDFFGDKFAIR